MTNRISIVVEGIQDETLVATIEKTIRDSFHATSTPGAWDVRVKPSRVSGRWDFNVHGVDVRHTMSIAVPPALLSTLIPRRFRETLESLDLSERVGVDPERTVLHAV